MMRRWVERSLVSTWSDGNKVPSSNQNGCHHLPPSDGGWGRFAEGSLVSNRPPKAALT